MDRPTPKGLSFSEKLSCYLIPYVALLTSFGTTFDRKVSIEFDKEKDRYFRFGEHKKVEQVKQLKKKSMDLFWTIMILILISGLIVSIV